jgi:hypothetical protein
MQHQIADRVFVLGAARPNLFFSQAAQAIFDASCVQAQLAGGVVEEDAFARVHTKQDIPCSRSAC